MRICNPQGLLAVQACGLHEGLLGIIKPSLGCAEPGCVQHEEARSRPQRLQIDRTQTGSSATLESATG